MTEDKDDLQLTQEQQQADAEERFKTFGEEVSWDKVPDLVLAGREVWSFGYDSNDPTNFTTLSEDDLEFFTSEADVSDWAPFRVSPLNETVIKGWTPLPAPSEQTPQELAAPHIKALETLGYIVVAVAPGAEYCSSLENEHLHTDTSPRECAFDGSDFKVNFFGWTGIEDTIKNGLDQTI